MAGSAFLDVYGDLLVSGKGIAAEDAKYTGLEIDIIVIEAYGIGKKQ